MLQRNEQVTRGFVPSHYDKYKWALSLPSIKINHSLEAELKFLHLKAFSEHPMAKIISAIYSL